MEDRRTIELSDEAAVYRAGDGQEIVYLTAIPYRGDVLYSPDGQLPYELVERRSNSSTDGGVLVEHEMFFEDPHHGRQGRFHLAGDEVVLDGVTFSKVPARVSSRWCRSRRRASRSSCSGRATAATSTSARTPTTSPTSRSSCSSVTAR